jgi:hypothetical protein
VQRPRDPCYAPAMRRNVFSALFALAAAGCAGCESSIMYSDADSTEADDRDYVRGPTTIKNVEFDALWSRAEWVLQMEGQAIDRDRTRYDLKQMVTHWDTRLAPTRFEGKRSRAWIRFEPLQPGEWNVAVAVQMQRNADIDMPSAASQAKWEEAESNVSRASVLVWKIESGFRNEDEQAGPAKK